MLILLVPYSRFFKKKDFTLKEVITFNIDDPFPGVSVPLSQAPEDPEEDGDKDKEDDADTDEDEDDEEDDG
jgi:hypothetical protein